MKHFRTRRGAFQRELKSWGDLITFDFLDMRKAADAGLGIDDGAREVLVIRDVATKMIAAIPTESRRTEQVVSALKRLFGRRKVKMAYSDVAPEFEAAIERIEDSAGSLTSGETQQQFSRGKNKSGNHQHRGNSHATCRITSAVLEFRIELCYAQPEH